MPMRPPTLAQRLRSAWGRNTNPRPSAATTTALAQQLGGDRAAEFAERLRAAVTARS
jgi:hypothetical protein